MVKEQGKFIGSIALTFALGGILIFGNVLLAVNTVAAGFEPDHQSVVSELNRETAELNVVGKDMTNTNEVSTVMKTLPDGTTVIVEYSYGESDTKATVTYSRDGEVYNYKGETAEAVIERFGGPNRWADVPLRYVKGEAVIGDIGQDDAISISMKAITEKYALKQTTLNRFAVTAEYYTIYEDIPCAVWWVNLYPTNRDEYSEIGCYTAVLNTQTGEVIQLLSAADSKG